MSVADFPAPAQPFASLSPREMAILRAYARLGMNKLIAQDFGLSLQTVKNHISSILSKMGTASMGQSAVIFALYERTTWPTVERRFRERRMGERRQYEGTTHPLGRVVA